jgi:hypothetical protein
MKFPEFPRLRRGPTSLSIRQLRVVLLGVGLDVQQKLDQVSEHVQTEQLLALADTLQMLKKLISFNISKQPKK